MNGCGNSIRQAGVRKKKKGALLQRPRPGDPPVTVLRYTQTGLAAQRL
jgi:hypothetical protein